MCLFALSIAQDLINYPWLVAWIMQRYDIFELYSENLVDSIYLDFSKVFDA